MADQATTVSGVLKIEIPSPALSLTLTFEKSDDGDSWTAERLQAALDERGVRNVTLADLETFIGDAAAADGPLERTLLEGTPPELPAPERVSWDEHLELPESLIPIRDAVLAEAPPPEITREVKEAVEKKKDVPKKGLLGIGAGKTETITVTETVTRREKVYIDPAVEDSKSVVEGQTLGTFLPAAPGGPGRDIFDRPIPAKQLVDSRFYLDDTITRSGDTLTAAVEGFLRIGRNWADIVAFAPHRWNVELSADQATCYLNLTPGHRDSEIPAGGDVLHAAIQLPYPEDSLMSADELDKLIRGQIESGEAARLPISSSRDASFDIVVTEDRLQALLYIHKGKGRGKHLNLKEVGAAIKASKLKNLDLKRIGDDIKAFYNSTEFDLTGYVLTEGRAATPGPDRSIEFSLRFNPDDKTEAQKRAISTAAPDQQPESLSSFPVEAIQKTAPVEHEQLVATVEPEAPGEPGVDVYGATIAGPPGEAPAVHLYENLTQQNAIIATTAPGVLDFAEIDGEYHLRVRAHVDASVGIDIADDRMSAQLTLREGSGTGRRLTMELIQEAIGAAGVTTGVDAEVIEKALAAAQGGVDVDGVTVATGTPPVDQSENTLEMLVDTDRGQAVRIRRDGTADYKTRDDITTVSKDQQLCRILPSQQEPIDGVTVTGEAVPARTVSGLELDLGDNIRREEQEDGSVLIIAEAEGEFIRERNRMEVRTTHTIKGDIDMSVGNVKFPGSVTIGGTVRSGFYVMSGGDIRIAGGVEAALLSSEGDIVINQGVKGAGKAVLRSKRNIMSPFVELATVLSVGDVILKSAVVRSRVKANGKIAFQGDKGRIIGGTIRARNGLEVTSVGSPRGIKTQISFGQDYLIADLIEKEEKEIEKVKTRITQLDVEMRKAEKESAEERLQGLRREKVKMLKLMEKRGLRLFTLRERFEQHFPSKVVVVGEVHTGTVFESHGRTYEITRPRKGIQVVFDPHSGNLDVSDLNGSE